MKQRLCVLLFILLTIPSIAQQPVNQNTPETHHYAIEIAGIRVGTMTAQRQPEANNRATYTLISDVKVNLLVYTVIIYYKVVNQVEGKKLMLSTVEARTNRGNYASRTEWKGDHYDITANQYKYKRQAVEQNVIDFPLSLLYFEEPIGRTKIYSEYFGNYFLVARQPSGAYSAVLEDREDEYIYQNGTLVKVIKHNSVKNFTMRRLD